VKKYDTSYKDTINGMSADMQLCLHNIRSGATFNYGSDTWILKQKESQKLEYLLEMCFFVTAGLKID
jgi:frataxin-like iron-binding protein CyaY